jgi:hypothetical protein
MEIEQPHSTVPRNQEDAKRTPTGGSFHPRRVGKLPLAMVQWGLCRGQSNMARGLAVCHLSANKCS